MKKPQPFPPTHLLPRVPLDSHNPPTSNKARAKVSQTQPQPKMLKDEISVLDIDINKRVRPCDTCRSAACAVYCRADSAYLCVECDAAIHSANSLASRHHRVSVHSTNSLVDLGTNRENIFEDEEETSSWLLLDPVKNNINENTLDEYLDLVDYNTCQDNQFTYPQKMYGSDCVVPIRSEMKIQIQHQNHNYQFGNEYETSRNGYHNPASVSHCVSVSSMDVGVVPESTTSEASISHPRHSKGTIDLFSSPPTATQLSPMDREARVLRYREKKKTRKFEKTIRYASRKAYAETRPRIKGRFAKRTDVEDEVDQMFATSVFGDEETSTFPSVLTGKWMSV